MDYQKDNINFTVIIPLYNKEISIRSTVESVLNQTYPYFELIIINDGSTDNSLAVAGSFKDGRIRIFDKQNGGVSSARNRGILEATNDYITFLDADDLWHPHTLQEFHFLITNFQEASVFVSNYEMTGVENPGSERRYYIRDLYYMLASYQAKWSLSLLLTGCVAAKKKCFQEIGGFKEGVTNGEDVDMWNRLACNYAVVKSEKVTTVYRLDSENKNCHMKDEDRVSIEVLEEYPVKEKIKNTSLQLYYGVGYLFRSVHIIQNRKGLKVIITLTKYYDWILRALLLVIKLRIMNWQIKTNF